MKRFLLLVLVPMLLVSQEDRMRISVLDFEGKGLGAGLLDAAYEDLETRLIETNRFTVIDKSTREARLKELKYQRSGCVTEECIVEIGRELSANYVVSGSINKIGSSYQINIKLVDMKLGKVTQKVTDRVKGDEDVLFDGIEKASLKLVRRISSTGSAPTQVEYSPQDTEVAYGLVEITTSPENANILIDGEQTGTSPLRKDSVVTGQHRIVIILPGYETLTKLINVDEGKSTIVNEILAPQTGILSIVSTPIGATVFIDGEPKGNTPISFPDLPAKDYIIKLAFEDYEEITNRVTVEYQSETTRKYDLKPLDGSLQVRTSPTNVNFTLDGKNYKSGESGLKIVTISVGRQIINFSKKGYENLNETVNIGPNENKFLEVNLKKLPAGVSSNPDLGFLTINTYNLSAQAKVKGIRATLDLPVEYLELKYGSYPLRVFQSGFETENRNVIINKQKTTIIEVNLKRKTARKALRYSIIPGGGQFYAENKTKSAIFFLASAGLATMFYNNYDTYNVEEPLVSQYMENYLNATDSDEIDQNFNTYQSQVNTVNDLQTQMILYGGALAVTWVVNLIDAYFFSGLLE